MNTTLGICIKFLITFSIFAGLGIIYLVRVYSPKKNEENSLLDNIALVGLGASLAGLVVTTLILIWTWS
jgi:hypothetical protein